MTLKLIEQEIHSRYFSEPMVNLLEGIFGPQEIVQSRPERLSR
jgi:hypothetical protein